MIEKIQPEMVEDAMCDTATQLEEELEREWLDCPSGFYRGIPIGDLSHDALCGLVWRLGSAVSNLSKGCLVGAAHEITGVKK